MLIYNALWQKGCLWKTPNSRLLSLIPDGVQVNITRRNFYYDIISLQLIYIVLLSVRDRRMAGQKEKQYSLNEVWPSFLDPLVNAADAAEDFAKFAWHVLYTVPPSCLSRIKPDEREDLVQAVITHCLDRNFKKLATLRNKKNQFETEKKPFRRWLATVAIHLFIDQKRKPPAKIDRNTVSVSPDGTDISSLLPDNEPDPSEILQHKETLLHVEECFKQLNLKCRIMIFAAIEGHSYSQIAVLLGLDPTDTKKISNDLNYCRDRLAQLVDREGIDVSMFRSKKPRKE